MRIVLHPGNELIVEFADRHDMPCDGRFQVDFDTKECPNQIVIREMAGLGGSVLGDAFGTLYVEDFAAEPELDTPPPDDPLGWVKNWFTLFDLPAKREGWLITNDPEGVLEIAKLDDPAALQDQMPDMPDEPIFECDGDAYRFVQQKARDGSRWHATALAISAAHINQRSFGSNDNNSTEEDN